uniref:Uncharacterized protein n=1 Tax=viral metagenome TaxID=1070528 RepID=A0A6M3XCQ9_9ZZZZ|tara:strand:+ start:625 stop:837 length:213 start_codon:yes stop_codon:yes gene_type:complete
MGQLNVSQQAEIAEKGAKRGKPTAGLIAPGKQVIKQQEAFWLLCHEGTLANTGDTHGKRDFLPTCRYLFR